MASEQLPNAPTVRKIRIGILVNGQQMPAPALLDFSVSETGYFGSATWDATLALNGLPPAYDAAYWALQPNTEVQLLAAVGDAAALAPVIGGMVDEVCVDLDAQIIQISGRDFSAALIDKLSTDKFTNQTSSQIATTLAQRFGLIPQVTDTTTPAGRYLNNQTDYMAEDVSCWRLLSYLAQQEGFDLYTVGKTLAFEPAVPDNSPLVLKYNYATPGNAKLGANAPRISMRQRKLLAGKVTVQVRSWQYQNKQAVLSTWVSEKTLQGPTKSGAPLAPQQVPTRAAAQGGAGADGPFYIERRAGLTQQQADQLAQKLLADYSSHEREVNYEGPGILGVTTRRVLRLTGTSTAFDQDYPIRELRRSFDWDRGFTMAITGKSGSPQEAIKL